MQVQHPANRLQELPTGLTLPYALWRVQPEVVLGGQQHESRRRCFLLRLRCHCTHRSRFQPIGGGSRGMACLRSRAACCHWRRGCYSCACALVKDCWSSVCQAAQQSASIVA